MNIEDNKEIKRIRQRVKEGMLDFIGEEEEFYGKKKLKNV